MLHASTYSGDNYPGHQSNRAASLGPALPEIRPVESAFISLDIQLNEQEKLTEVLLGRLAPILVPFPAERTEKGCTEVRQLACVLQCRIEDQADRVCLHNQRLAELISNLQL